MLAIGRDLGESGALRGLSERARAELVRADNGNDGLRAFYERQPDLVVLDLDLPDSDGLEILATIRALSDVPLIALTATGADPGPQAAVPEQTLREIHAGMRRMGAALARSVSAGEHRVVSDAGHLGLCFRRPDVVVRAIRDVVDRAARG